MKRFLLFFHKRCTHTTRNKIIFLMKSILCNKKNLRNHEERLTRVFLSQCVTGKVTLAHCPF